LRSIGPLAGMGLVTFATGQIAHYRPATVAGGALLAVAMAGYLALVATYFWWRTRPLDPALGHIAAAYVGLAATVCLGLALLFIDGPTLQRGVAAYALMAVLGWLVLLIVGVYYRIIPFLTWLNLGGAGAAGRDPVGLMPRRVAWASLGVLAGGVWLMAGGVGMGSEVAARTGAILFACGVFLLLGQYARLIAIVRRTAR
jgi:hypothetical protein